jgi:hypothetical protein
MYTYTYIFTYICTSTYISARITDTFTHAVTWRASSQETHQKNAYDKNAHACDADHMHAIHV